MVLFISVGFIPVVLCVAVFLTHARLNVFRFSFHFIEVSEALLTSLPLLFISLTNFVNAFITTKIYLNPLFSFAKGIIFIKSACNKAFFLRITKLRLRKILFAGLRSLFTPLVSHHLLRTGYYKTVSTKRTSSLY